MNNNKTKIYSGVLKKHSRGFGFVQLEGDDMPFEEIFVAKANINGAMNKDRVEVDLIPKKYWDKSPEGIVSKVLERYVTDVVGTMEQSKQFGFVVSGDKDIKDDIFVKKSDFNGAKNGDKVSVHITKYADKNNKAEGVIKEIVARKNDPAALIKGLIKSKGLSLSFPKKVVEEAQFVASKGIKGEDIRTRIDLRNENVVTVDGPTAKDLDDGISIKVLDNGNFFLGVHIADVSHYVKEGGRLDKEAFKRGNSVYLINRVIPMLPEQLSNGVCSLNPGEDKLTLTCQMEIDQEGTVINHNICQSVICSKERMVYDDLSDILENEDDKLIKRYSYLYEDFKSMEKLAKILRDERKKGGSLDFNFPEATITLDIKEVPIEIAIEERRTANRIIEEFMLEANMVIAEHFYWLNVPFVYRVHNKPEREDMLKLKAFLKKLGISLKGNLDNIYPSSLNDVMTEVKGQSNESIINTVILRSMKKASYSPQCDGHFGLAFKYYCHFTSPIRRYPDLIIHRIIKNVISGEISEIQLKSLEKKVANAAETSSLTELKAQELERDVEKIKKAEYILNFVDQEFPGVISGVTEYGIYVQLDNTIEGMIRLDNLKDDYYIYDGENYRVIGERTKQIYALGQKVVIRVLGAKPMERQIDFAIVNRKQGRKK